MSRSEPVATNPAQKFFRWNGADGKLEYYNKETKENIEVPLPFEFLVIDELATVTGYCEPDESGYWSNEVRSVGKEEFTVKTSKGTKQVGLYKDLTDVRAKGAKYAKSVYIVYFENDEPVLANIKVSGSALGPWIELGKAYKVENGKTVLTGSESATKGKNEYFVPVFEYQHSTGVEDKLAIEMDRILQKYLKTYLNAKEEEPLPLEPDEIIEDNGEPINFDDLPTFDSDTGEQR